MANPNLTYIVPVYNTEAYVLKCLQSIVNQGIPEDEYEVIVVDDGSTDSSLSIIETFAREHPQVRVFKQANAGVSKARNLAIDNARGRFVQFVDSDDYLCDHTMAPLLQRAIEIDLDALLFNYDGVDMEGHPLPHDRKDVYDSTGVMTGVEYLRDHFLTPYVCWYLVSREHLNRGQWRFNTSLVACEDGALNAQFLLNASRVAHDATSPYRYVRRDDSAMRNPDIDHLRRRIFSQVDAAASINDTIKRFEDSTGQKAPVSVAGLRNVYLYFSMTKALTCGIVDEVLSHIKQAGLFPFPCVGPEASYHGMKWKMIHILMMRPGLWKLLSKIYRLIRK